MKIIVDAMGGDKAPLEIVKGAAIAAQKYSAANIFLVGDTDKIKSAASEADVSLKEIEIIHANSVVTMEDEPSDVMRSKKDSSMAVGLRALKEDGDAFISAGNTGALLFGSSLIIRCHKGISRASIATLLPFDHPLLLLDSGANVIIKPEYLCQWGLMGSIYMKSVLGIENPKVGLLNNGSEECKGTPVMTEAYKLLSELGGINFVGNVEGRDVPFGACDVLLTDGFTGNILLKYTEGIGSMFAGKLKGMFYKNFASKLAGLFVKDGLSEIKKSFDASAYGGAPIIGLNKCVIKAHGNSNSVAVINAVRQAVTFLENGTGESIAAAAKYLEDAAAKGGCENDVE